MALWEMLSQSAAERHVTFCCLLYILTSVQTSRGCFFPRPVKASLVFIRRREPEASSVRHAACRPAHNT